MITQVEHGKPEAPSIYKVVFTTEYHTKMGWGWMSFSDIVKLSGLETNEVWQLAETLSKDEGLVAVAILCSDENYRFFNINKGSLTIWDVEGFHKGTDYAHRNMSPVSIVMGSEKENALLLPAGLGFAILNEVYQREHGCWHEFAETYDELVPCNGDVCSRDDDAPDGIGHQCGNTVCTRCGETLEDSYADACKEYDDWYELN